MTRHVALATFLFACFASPLCAQQPAASGGQTYQLKPTPKTVTWGYYDAKTPPVLHIQSGDTVEIQTLVTSSPERFENAGMQPDRIEQPLRDIFKEVKEKGPGVHILTGPVYVEGALPGDVLEVRILSIDFSLDYGYNGCSGILPENCYRAVTARIIPIDAKAMTAQFAPGIVIPLRPFFGSMGVAPAPELGRVSSNPPGKHAGNLDNKDLVAGTTLFIPVFAPGALFEVGDGHVAQGDGEVDQTAIETSLRGKLQLTVRKGMKLAGPRAETPTHFISMGIDKDLTAATKIAIQEMIDFLAATKGLTKH